MISGPEISRCLNEFEHSSLASNDDQIRRHHSANSTYEHMFKTKVNSLKQTMLELGNPFLENGTELYSLESNIVMSSDCLQNVMTIKDVGIANYTLYLEQRITGNSVSIFSKIPKNNLSLFKTPKNSAKSTLLLKSLKSDVQLFSNLFIISANRDLDLNEFFSFENHNFPPSISINGLLRTGDKAALLKCLPKPNERIDNFDVSEEDLQVNTIVDCDNTVYDIILYDGPALVHILEPRGCKTFDDYSTLIFEKHIQLNANKHNVKRIDIVWDQYKDGSIKSQTRSERGSGGRKIVRPNSLIPKNWPTFLHNSDNKVELFHLLATNIASSTQLENMSVYSTYDNDVITNSKGKWLYLFYIIQSIFIYL